MARKTSVGVSGAAAPADQGRRLEARQIGKFTLLNDEKLSRVLDWIDGKVVPVSGEEQRILADAVALGDHEAILAL